MRNIFILISGLAIALIIYPNSSFAWSCAESLEPKDLFKRHHSVFIGKVVELSYENVGRINPKSRVTFEVKSSLKGNHGDKQTVVTSAHSQFIEGNEYLVYAYKTTEKNYLYKYEEGELATDMLCGGTKELSLAEYDLEQINELKNKNSNAIKYMIIVFLIASIIVIWRIFTCRRGKVE